MKRGRFEDNMDEEMRFHLDAYAEDLMRSGVPAEEARRRARLEFGAIDASKEECRSVWGFQWMTELRSDLRHTLRRLRQTPGFAIVAILSLALGIGANSAVFGLVDAVILRMAPFQDPEQLVFVRKAGANGQNGGPSYPIYEALRNHSNSPDSAFQSVAAFSGSSIELTIDGVREQTQGLWVSGNFYSMLGARALKGRAILPSDDEIIGQGGSSGPVVVISDAFWQRRFGGDADILGRTLLMSGAPVTIVGIMPANAMTLDVGRAVDIAVPMMLSNRPALRDASSFWMEAVARLKPGASLLAARAEADAIYQPFMADVAMPAEIRKLWFAHIELAEAGRGLEDLRLRFSTPLTILMLLAGLVLIAACANVANLLLARATARQREVAVQVALGARRGRLFRQALTEAGVLVTAGASAGIVLARWGQTLLAKFFEEGLPGNSRIVLDLSLDSSLIAFTTAVSVTTGLIFGIVPVLRATRVDAAEALQGGSRTISGNRFARRSGRALVVLQVAVSTVLLVGAGLFIRTVGQLQAVDLGMAPDRVLTMEIAPEQQEFGTPAWQNLQDEIFDRVSRIPAVRSVAWASMTPLSGRDRMVRVDVPTFTPASETDKDIHLVSVSPTYFETYAIPLRGRAFTIDDVLRRDASARAAILNETAARFYFGETDAIGKIVRFGVRPGGKSSTPLPPSVYEVVGVARDVVHEDVRTRAERFVYLPIRQSIDVTNRLALAVQYENDGGGLAAEVQRVVRGVSSTLLITNVVTMDQQVQRSLLSERLVEVLTAVFGVLALVLAGIGLYGILAVAAAGRRSEFGVRLALGAKRGKIAWLVFREALALTAAGVLIGAPLAVGAGRAMQSLLFGVEPSDFQAVAAAIVAQVAVAAVAGLVPARRASRSDPMAALRAD